jgi:hypothetical protein
MSFPYFAILGRQPELGLAELEALYGGSQVQPFGRHALLSELPELPRLGGSIKVGRVVYEGKLKLLEEALKTVDLPWPESGKINFGLSFYDGRITTRDVMATGLTLKKYLRSKAPACRRRNYPIMVYPAKVLSWS